jgi:hypothetical protein
VPVAGLASRCRRPCQRGQARLGGAPSPGDGVRVRTGLETSLGSCVGGADRCMAPAGPSRATTWCPYAGQLEHLWGLPALARCLTEDEAATRPTAAAAKLAAALAVLEIEGCPLIWIDDDAIPSGGDELERLRSASHRSLLIAPARVGGESSRDEPDRDLSRGALTVRPGDSRRRLRMRASSGRQIDDGLVPGVCRGEPIGCAVGGDQRRRFAQVIELFSRAARRKSSS